MDTGRCAGTHSIELADYRMAWHLFVELVPLNKCPQQRQGHGLIAVDKRSGCLGAQIHIHLTPHFEKSGHVLQALRVRRGRYLSAQSRVRRGIGSARHRGACTFISKVRPVSVDVKRARATPSTKSSIPLTACSLARRALSQRTKVLTFIACQPSYVGYKTAVHILGNMPSTASSRVRSPDTDPLSVLSAYHYPPYISRHDAPAGSVAHPRRPSCER